MSLEIIICTEKGPLENMAKLLVSSIRRIGGEFKNIPIYSYQPREGKTITDETKRFFDENEVILIDEILNDQYQDYPLANKPLACSHRERNSNADYLLFIDNDSMFLDYPDLLVNGFTKSDIAIGNVDFGNIGTDITFRKGDATYWKKAYQKLNVKPRFEIKTRVGKEKILEYYNSGFVMVRREKEIFNQWLINFKILMDCAIRPDKLFFLEQSSLSATIAQMDLKVLEIGKKYNFPIHSLSKKWRGFYPYSLNGVKHIHYHKLFSTEPINKSVLKKISKLKDGKDLNRFISSYIKELHEAIPPHRN